VIKIQPKLCPLCKNHEIVDWESVCWWCWQFVVWHDGDFGTKWAQHLITLNIVREECRKAGFDPFMGFPF